LTEKVKSALLFFLVALSLYLTYQLWYGEQPAALLAEDVYERIVVEKPRPLAQVITPATAAVAADDGLYVLREGDSDYYLLWETISQMLQELSLETVSENQALPGGASLLFQLNFKPLLPVGAELPWMTGTLPLMVSELELYSVNEGAWLVLTAEASDVPALQIQLPPDNVSALKEVAAQIRASDKITYTLLDSDQLAGLTDRNLDPGGHIYVPREIMYLDTLLLKAEVIDRELLLKTFFIDYSLARMVEEKDGNLIYTDGERGLRLTSYGLEYTYPRMDEAKVTLSYSDALTNCSGIISYHGGWPSGLRLESLAISGWGQTASYAAEWKQYYQGYQLHSNKQTRAYFNDRGLIHYTRALYTVEGSGSTDEEQYPVAEWPSALQKAVELFTVLQPGSDSALRLDALELSYVVKSTGLPIRAEPAWLVKINGVTFLLEADNLAMIKEEDLL
jgi:regulatory protein YycH of two-component signal transduction system YycFG